MLRLLGLARQMGVLLLCLLLAGCNAAIWDHAPPPPPTYAGIAIGAATGAAIGGATAGGVGAAVGVGSGALVGFLLAGEIAHHLTLLGKLRYYGVQTVEVGDTVRMLLPAEKIFVPHSPKLNSHYYFVLNMVAKFLRSLKKVSIKIAVFSDNQGLWQRNLALTRARAAAMVDYLWAAGVSTPYLYGQGYGSQYPIASNATAHGRRLNQRIEISLRKIEN